MRTHTLTVYAYRSVEVNIHKTLNGAILIINKYTFWIIININNTQIYSIGIAYCV